MRITLLAVLKTHSESREKSWLLKFMRQLFSKIHGKPKAELERKDAKKGASDFYLISIQITVQPA